MNAKWLGTFTIMDIRPIKNKSGEVFKRTCDLGFMGGKLTADLDANQFQQIEKMGIASNVTADGTFALDYKGNLSLQVSTIKSMDAK